VTIDDSLLSGPGEQRYVVVNRSMLACRTALCPNAHQPRRSRAVWRCCASRIPFC